MKYKVGDKVRVVEQLPQETEELYVTPSMKRLEGEEVTIAAAYGDDKMYDIEEDGGDNYWEEEMFEDGDHYA